MSGTPGTTRRQNRRGEGTKLHDDILAAASVILEKTGHEDAVTLRGVARHAGITAPAIYAHFADREEILLAVVTRTFSDLAATLARAVEGEREPVARLLAVCRAYLDFATERRHHYRVLFERHRTTVDHAVEHAPGPADVASMVGANAFGVLLEAVRGCIEAGLSSATVAESAATRLWIGLHGCATLRDSLPWFPWPDRDTLLTELVVRLGDLPIQD